MSTADEAYDEQRQDNGSKKNVEMVKERVRTGAQMGSQKETEPTGKRLEVDNLKRHSFRKVAVLQLFCGSTTILGLWVVPGLFGINLTDQPIQTLQIVMVLVLPVFLITFSLLQLHPKTGLMAELCAISRGLLSLPVGVCIATSVALVFGAPLASEYAAKTLYWAALMSVFVVVPGATVMGASWPRWIRIFGSSEPIGLVEIAICIPAHGAAIGAWVGAWPMPLDWGRPWQEWPVCCTYGAVGGYLAGLIGSLLWTYHRLGDKQD